MQGNLGYSSLVGLDLSTLPPVVFPAFQPASEITATFENLAPGTSSAELVASYTRGNDPTRFGFVDVTAAVSGGSSMVTSPIVPFGDTTNVTAHLTISGFDPVDYTQQIAQLTPTVAIDAATMLHPATAGSFDPASGVVAWSEGSAGVDTPASVTTELSWQTSASINVFLTFTAPHGTTTSMAVPQLPEGLGSLAPGPAGVLYRASDVRSYVGKTYHDALVGHTDGAAQWHTTF
jgi:hypothetical protein